MRLFLTHLSKKDKGLLFAAIWVVLGQVLLETWIPALMSEISTMIQTEGTAFEAVLKKGISMLVLAAAAFALAFLGCYLISIIGSSLTHSIRADLFGKVIAFSLPEVSSFGTGTLITRCTTDVSNIQTFISQYIHPLLQAPVMVIVVLLRIGRANSVFMLVAAAAFVVLIILVVYIFRAAGPLVRNGSKIRDLLATKTREHVYGIRLIHSNNAQELQSAGYAGANEQMCGYDTRMKKIIAPFSPTVSALMYGLSVAIYVLGAFMIAKSGPSQKVILYSEMVEFVSYVALLLNALVNIVMVVLFIPTIGNASRRINEVLDTEVQILDGEEKIPVSEEARGTVEFKDVSFRYPGSADVSLSHVSFKVNPGETVAVIGGTGSGKTSLLNLIPRLYDATEGEVLVDGKPVRDYRLNNLRNRIGYVPQNSFLFYGPIRWNIGYGDNGKLAATMDQIVQAAQTGQADEFIREKEEGYETMIQTGGTNLSGGQRQRVTISRAICRDPEIFLFDDSFSALDFKTDARLRKALRETAAGSTVLIVGQRISTIRNADRIIVMDQGRIVGQGRHEELLEACPVYREIVESQTMEEAAV